jgi:hypothetical protein
LLKYTYPPLSYSCISTENINNIAAYTARDLLRRLDNKEKENRLNYDLVHKFSKVRILLLYISSRYERESFFRRVNYILYNVPLGLVRSTTSSGIINTWSSTRRGFSANWWRSAETTN